MLLLCSLGPRVDDVNVVKRRPHSFTDNFVNYAHVGLPECFVLRGLQAFAGRGILDAVNALNLVVHAEKLVETVLDRKKHRNVQRGCIAGLAELVLSLRP